MFGKFNNRVSYIFVALFMLILTAGCGNLAGYINFEEVQEGVVVNTMNNGDYDGKRPLRIAFASVISPKETRQSYQEMVNYISNHLGQPAVLIQRKTYEELNMLLAGGEVDIAFVSTGAYTAYNGLTPIELLAMVQTDDTVMYNAYLIVQADSDIQDFYQLQGKVFAFTDPLSYSGRLAVDYMLYENYNTTAEKFFKRCFYTYNHDKSLWAVANKLADGAGIDSQIYDFAKKTNPEMVNKVRIIATMQQAPTGPVVMRRELPERIKEQLRDIFYNMHQQPKVATAMKKVIIDRFVEPRPELYDRLRRKYNQKERLPGA